ncbi:hypothetical protein [Methylopila sp. M107]|uniref:Dyp-type peroxidase n=1 Tax=Methylopila sp. M107 TaxID=1101190 RepID=UPI00039C9C86|nr:hypothetical protein [Methylopila sp. M107]
MGQGPVTAPGKPKGWRLKSPHDRQAQGIVVTGFGALPYSEALFLRFDWKPGPGDKPYEKRGAALKALMDAAPPTDSDGADPRAAIVALTWLGMRKLGLDEPALQTFSEPFRDGMCDVDRLRRLGDRNPEGWLSTVIPGGPEWSGNVAAVQVAAGARQPELGAAMAPDQRSSMAFDPGPGPTPQTVHALLLLYCATEDEAAQWKEDVKTALAPRDVVVERSLKLSLREIAGVGYEHFGFADGLSQPIPFGLQSDVDAEDGDIELDDGTPAKRDPLHGVPLGEILIGHVNGHRENAPGPLVAESDDGLNAGLTADGAPEGFLNFGLDGSYMVVRELRQDVAAFWNAMDANAKRIVAHDPTATHVTADWLAERVVGRSRAGHMLCPGGYLKPTAANCIDNDFGFFENDPEGLGCPPGSHVRRANPRDALAPSAASQKTLRDAANNHRILRRGRKYGSDIADLRTPDGADRGLLFICLNTDIERQFEFVQQTWLMNRNFATLFDEADPLIGPEGGFTIREEPLRRIVAVDTFVEMVGGEYFFLPSLPALNYLASL